MFTVRRSKDRGWDSSPRRYPLVSTASHRTKISLLFTHRRHHHRAVQPGDEDQPVRHVLAMQESAPRMEPRSSIINTSSVQAVTPSPELMDYATTKAGIHNFTKALAQDVAEKGIRV